MLVRHSTSKPSHLTNAVLTPGLQVPLDPGQVVAALIWVQGGLLLRQHSSCKLAMHFMRNLGFADCLAPMTSHASPRGCRIRVHKHLQRRRPGGPGIRRLPVFSGVSIATVTGLSKAAQPPLLCILDTILAAVIVAAGVAAAAVIASAGVAAAVGGPPPLCEVPRAVGRLALAELGAAARCVCTASCRLDPAACSRLCSRIGARRRRGVLIRPPVRPVLI